MAESTKGWETLKSKTEEFIESPACIPIGILIAVIGGYLLPKIGFSDNWAVAIGCFICGLSYKSGPTIVSSSGIPCRYCGQIQDGGYDPYSIRSQSPWETTHTDPRHYDSDFR